MDLDLEADLGIDTVKQAEVFAAIREAYGIPFDDTLKLRDYPTLNHVVAFVRERSGVAPAEEPAVAPAPAAEPTPTAAAPSSEPPGAPEPAAAGPEPSAAPAQDEVTERVLAVLSEETGYPTELLDMDLDLEADLGIDTVKQAEVFAAIREAYGIPFDDTLKLRDYPTLNHVVAFVRERSGVAPAEEPAVAPAPAAEPTPTAAAPSSEPAGAPEPAAAGPEPSAAPAQDEVTERVLAVLSEETGYPTELLDMDLDLEADLGIDTVKQAEVFAAIREAYGIPFDDTLKLRDYPTLNHVVAFVRERSGVAPAEEPAVAPAPAAEPTPTAAAPSSEPAGAPEPAAAGPEPSAAPAQDEVTERVLAVLSEETGYPTELLDMDLDLEADLGIDTVKQAEVFAAIREAYGIPFDDTLKLRDYPTLNHVVAFVRERSGVAPAEEPAVAPAPAAEPTPTAAAPSSEPPGAPEPAAAGPEPSAAPAQDEVTERVLAVLSEETGYPTELLDMDLDLEADLGIDTVKQAEVFAAIREAYGIPFDDTLKLRDYPTLNHVVAFVRERADLGEGEPEAAPEAAPADGAPVEGEPRRFPRRVPLPVVRPPLEHCVPTGISLEAGSRVIVMPDTGGVATALEKKLRKLGVEVLMADPHGDELESQIAGLDGRGAGQRRLLAARPGRRAAAGRARSGGLDRGPARPGEAARAGDARARRSGRERRDLPRRGHPPRWPPRLRRRGRDLGDGRRGDRLRQVTRA